MLIFKSNPVLLGLESHSRSLHHAHVNIAFSRVPHTFAEEERVTKPFIHPTCQVRDVDGNKIFEKN